MTIATDADLEVLAEVRAELEWTPDVDAAAIGVAVDDGTITLSGEVGSYAERLAAKKAALRVRGVRAIVDDLAVETRGATWSPGEVDTAQQVDRALRSATTVPQSVQAEVHGHDVTLTGEVDWECQRQAARRAVQFLRGVSTINDRMTLKERASASDTRQRIADALTRNAQIDADTIQVAVDGTRVTLTGRVRSWAERLQAADAAWSSPHVTDVDNRIYIV
ncbi:MAG TPA: BON domain-containing protein [Microbacterium sp.]|uniref:BON domain-containing protein n=1 Tax=Microbacterium sp. TaxID=51671 RepID=UPI002B48089B|nr:BON domain-containing protein [Microbacterium sp.]HKT56523.1 BON domain-containing protein [Microbacterium sp.]